MDPVAFAEQYDTRPQQLLASMDQQNQQTMQNVLQGTSIFQQGNLERQRLGQEKQLSMAQMAQNQQQFTALQGLREQELQMNQGKTMADIAAMNAQMQGQIISNQQQTLAAQQAPLKLENSAYLTQNMPKVLDPQTGPDAAVQLLSQVPHPEAMTDTDRQSFLSNADLARSHSAATLAFQGNLAGQLGQITDAARMGLHMQNYMKDPNGYPYDPRNFNMDALNTDVHNANLLAQKNTINLQTQARIDEAKATTQWHNNTDRTKLMTLSNQAKQADADLTRLQSAPFAKPADIQAARARRDQAVNAFNQAANLPPDDDSSTSDTMATPGATGAAANGAPAPNPAASAWLSNVVPQTPAANGP